MLKGFPKEKITLIKQNGSEIQDISALVSDGVIMIEDTTISIEEEDCIRRELPNGDFELYQIKDRGLHKGTGSISDHYQIKVNRIKSLPSSNTEGNKRRKVIFISHSSNDGVYAGTFVDLLQDIGINEQIIVCSSYPGTGIPFGENIYKWLAEQFQMNDLHVFYLFSKNYYQSAASLNEMGATWVLKHKWDGILLPGFEFEDIKGCIDKEKMFIKLDDEEQLLNHRLGELKNSLIKEFDLTAISDTRWNTIRGRFLSTVKDSHNTSVNKVKINRIEKDQNNDSENNKENSNPILYANVLLYYAAMSNGIISSQSYIDGCTSYEAGGYEVYNTTDPREAALWEEAVDYLVQNGYIKKSGKKSDVYRLTSTAYSLVDSFKMANDIKDGITPQELIEELNKET